ncbi:MAG: membrane protein insertase YidC [Parvularculaceae bacterium]|jgi:YidC/Oxa1 family membrane protein insertase|nr:membrane protein insertase YidC [Parvularculaceae bacterium]
MDRNSLLAIVLSVVVLLGWEALYMQPQREAARKALEAQQTAQAAAGEIAEPEVDDPDVAGPAANQIISVEAALAQAQRRLPIDTPSVTGSINLDTGRIDDLSLKNYRETLDASSPMIRLLSPANTEHGHYLQLGWAVGGKGAQSVAWEAPAGARLTPSSPVTLTRRDNGVVFETKIEIDDKYLFTVTQSARNVSEEAHSVTPFGVVIQRGIPEGAGKYQILHEGPIAVVENSLFERKYKKAQTAVVEAQGQKGWVGITNKYWLAAAIPPQGETFTVKMRNISQTAQPIFQAAFEFAPHTIAPGESHVLQSHLFAGPKDVDLLQSYEKPRPEGLGIWDFDRAVDWGNFWFLTRPIFTTLNFFGDRIHNWGVAILILTLIVKLLMFPVANRAFETMSKMKKLQPELQALQARYKDDKMKLQQEMMALYQKEKMNPLAGCLPMLLQIPIFYALYKVLFVTIELRHQPFALWIKDLSAPDPTNIFNLFGLLPYDPTAVPFIGAFLAIGVLPLLYGLAMAFQMKLNPPPQDPVQAQVFAIMPWMFVFLFASFSSGLVLYWLWSSILGVAQQIFIMKKNGVDVDWKNNFRLPWSKKLEPSQKPSVGGK